MPSTSFDAHGLMLTAGEYDGPVICLEPKWMYRQTLGPAFPEGRSWTISSRPFSDAKASALWGPSPP